MMGQYQYICLLNQYEHNDIREEIKFIYLKGIRKSLVPTSKEIYQKWKNGGEGKARQKNGEERTLNGGEGG